MLRPFKNEMNREERQKFILDGDRESLFIFSKPKYEIPEKARLFNTIVWEKCGEGAPEHKIRFQEGKRVCLDCFKEYIRNF